MNTGNKRLTREGVVKWLPATYGPGGSVTLGGRVTLIHPAWTALFTKIAPGRLDRLAAIVGRLDRTLVDLLSVLPIGVVEGTGEQKKKSPLLVISHVDYYCLAVERRLDRIPVCYLADGADCVSIARIDGLLDPLLRAYRTDADQLIRTILRSEQAGIPLIAHKGYPNGAYLITIEDLAYLLQRDTSTVHLKLGGGHPRRPPQERKDGDDATNPIPKGGTLPSGEQRSDGKETPGTPVTTSRDSTQVAAPVDEVSTQGDTPAIAPMNHRPPPVAPTTTRSDPPAPNLKPPAPRDGQNVPDPDGQPAQNPPPKRPSPTAKRTRRRVEDELQGCLFPSAEPKVK